ncbi:MAG: GDP-mannose 4,6-dehydratase [Candidatus Dadabacteria bacterium]
MGKEKKVAIITGITGQDGAYLSKFLIEKGYKVFGFMRDTSFPYLCNLEYLGISGKVELVRANLLDLSNLIRLLDNIQPDEIYNLAAQSSVGLSFEQPLWTLEFNSLSTANLLEAVRVAKSDAKFYQASSSEMYGNVNRDNLPVTEKTPMHPISPYAISKAAAHWITINYREAYGLFAVCGILFNHESALRGKNFVTRKVLDTAVKISRGLADNLVLGNLNVFRDWGYAPEYIKAIWLMLQQEEPDDFIICSGEAHSLEEFVKRVFRKLDLDFERLVEIDERHYRPMDLEIVYGDNSKAKRLLGWQYNMSFEKLIDVLVEDEIRYMEWKLNSRE